jgi:hypothetical protein
VSRYTPDNSWQASDALVGCELVHSVEAELALGSLYGRQRASALAHIAECRRCHQVVNELSMTADAVLLATPAVDPPVGFEVRLSERWTQDTERRRRRTRRVGLRIPVLAVAAALVLFATTLGIVLGQARHMPFRRLTGVHTAAFREPRSAPYESSIRGEAIMSVGRPTWVMMTVQDKGWSGWATCVVSVAGRSERVGAFHVRDGIGSWVVKLVASSQSVSSVRLVAPSGNTLATASFPT